MVDFLLQVALQTWWIVKEAAVFLLFGFALAGVLAVLVPARTLLRFFGTGNVKSVLWASAIGAPLPLCSCGVLPTALGLRRQGATKGATVAFLISTPETGVDSISLSYALMDPVITIFRPVTALVTAITAGLATNLFGERRPSRTPASDALAVNAAPAAPERCCEHEGGPDHGHDHHHDHATWFGPTPAPAGAPPVQTLRAIYGYAFRDLLDEIGHWLVLGIVLSGVLAASLPPDVFERYLNDPLASMLLMLVIGIPMYTCASAATPVMATLVMSGFNPGAALVFLLAGPATSISSITVLLKFLGARVLMLYLASIAVMSLLAGFALNWTYQALAIDPRATFGTATGFVPEPLKVAGGLLLLTLLLFSLRRTPVPAEWRWLRDRVVGLSGIRLSATRLKVGALAALVLLYLGSGLFSVQPGERGIELRFGRVTAADLAPGLHYRLPWPFESHRIVPTDLVRRAELGFRSPADLGVRTLARNLLTVGGPSNPVPNAIKSTGFWFEKQSVPEESFLLTGDGNFIDVRFSVQYRVEDRSRSPIGWPSPRRWCAASRSPRCARSSRPARSMPSTRPTAARSSSRSRTACRRASTAMAPGSSCCRCASSTCIRRRRFTTRFATSRARRRTSCGRSTGLRPSRSRRSIRPWARRPPGSRPPRPSRAHASGTPRATPPGSSSRSTPIGRRPS